MARGFRRSSSVAADSGNDPLLRQFPATTSLYLAKFVADRLGLSEQEAYRTRHQNRNLWHRIGKEVRKKDPGFLLRESLVNAEIVGGIRELV